MSQQQRAMWIKVGELLEEYDMAGSSFAEDLQAALNQLLEQSALAQEHDRVRECAKRLVEHADFKLGGALSADSKAKDIPSNAISNVKARHLAALRDALEATPPAQLAAWVGLTDEEIDKAWRDADCTKPWDFHRIDVSRAIEAKLKEKNGGKP